MSDIKWSRQYLVEGGGPELVVAETLEVALQLASERVKDAATRGELAPCEGVKVLPVTHAAASKPATAPGDKKWDRDPAIDWTGIEGGHP